MELIILRNDVGISSFLVIAGVKGGLEIVRLTSDL